MKLEFTALHPTFAAESSPVLLRDLHDDAALQTIREGMERYGVLVFRDQEFDDGEQIEFAKRLDSHIHARTGNRVLGPSRFGDEALTDVSNVAADGAIMRAADRKRLHGLGNRLWHTDASFESPRGRYSMLMAYVLPEDSPPTEFADSRTAYDALPEEKREALHGLEVYHSIAHSRRTLGFEFSEEEAAMLPGATHPLVLQFPRTGRRSLYLASHASHIVGWTLPESRLQIMDLMEHITARANVYSHDWRARDLVIWDNRASMHRARPFDDIRGRRELRRVTTLDIDNPAEAAA
ncbi:MAG: TauD/TfdA family dioxygenase [Pseudomonadota bacterium]